MPKIKILGNVRKVFKATVKSKRSQQIILRKKNMLKIFSLVMYYL